MLTIKDIEVWLNLADKKVSLDFVDKTINKDKEVYSFSHKERKITATVSLEIKDHLTVGSVGIDIENESCRENYNLKSQSPVEILVELEELPTKLCATYQHRDWWTRPAFVSSYEDVPKRTQSLFLQGEKSYGYILPIVGEKTKSYITKGIKSSIVFEMTAYTGGINQIDDLCFIMGEGKELHETIEKVFKEASDLKAIPLKVDRPYPEMFEYIGWCSWDAFYTDISEEKVIEKVEEIKKKHIPIRWILLDDGWLDTVNEGLTSFIPNLSKFPNEFKEMVHKIKDETDIEWVGVWHAFGGYWGGVAPESQLAIDMKDYLYKTKNGKLIPHFKPEKGFRFWREWYTYLRNQGIDFVKVDGQSALKNYYNDNEEIAKVSRGSHEGLEAAVSMLMGGNIINCMGMAMENIFSRPSSSISRNSDDFVPGDKNGFREHMLQNAYNSLYHDQVNVCDWDMYWTNHKDARKHALVRAISGGPIYISDKIGETIYEEIMPLIYQDGRILRMDRCAKPAIDCTFDSPLENRSLKLTNTVNGTGAIAAFHISETAEQIEDHISPCQIYDLQGEVFGAYNYFEKTFKILKRDEEINVKLTQDEYALILFIPMEDKITPIGLINKYISTHGVKTIHTDANQRIIALVEGGIFAFYKKDIPGQVMVNGKDMTKHVIKENGFYSIDLSHITREIFVTIE